MNGKAKLALALGAAALAIPIFSNGLMTPAEIVPPEGAPDEFGIRHVGINGYYLALKRRGDEEHDLREWITPDAPLVRKYSSLLWRPDRDTFILNCWYWITSSNRYAYQSVDYWYWPSEVIGSFEAYNDFMSKYAEMRMPILPPARPEYDCDDVAYTTAALLIAGGAEAYANIGYCFGRPHAWVTVVRDGTEYIIEATLPEQAVEGLAQGNPWMPAESYPEYSARYKFDNLSIRVLTN
jgi:hypothetical protein